MQPITQVSLDPKLNDIRHLRADQEFCGVIGCFGSIWLTSFRTAVSAQTGSNSPHRKPHGAQLEVEPPSADPHARWCGEGARKRACLPDFGELYAQF